MINQKLSDFEEEVKPIADIMTNATIEMYQSIVTKFLPTPTKIHYLFNLRDISKIFQGLLRANKTYHDTRHAMTRLWIHESFRFIFFIKNTFSIEELLDHQYILKIICRVFSDRLVNTSDMESFVGMISDTLGSLFDQTYHNICPGKVPPVFGIHIILSQSYT